MDVYSKEKHALNPKITTLIVIDMQNDFCHSDGIFSRQGYNTSYVREVIPALQELLETCRSHHVPVIFVRFAFREDLSDAGKRYLEVRGFLRQEGLRDGTWGTQIIDELKPFPSEYIIKKTRYSAFYNTDLEVLLQGLGSTTLLITGTGANGCVDSTIRDAFYHDYKIILIKECVGTWDKELREATFKNVKYAFGEIWSKDHVIFVTE